MTAARLLFKTKLIVAGRKELFITFQNAVFQYVGNNRTYSYTTKVFDGYGLRIHTEVIIRVKLFRHLAVSNKVCTVQRVE